jgi:membrane-associated PAP2 superfamily phosphatase
MLHPLFTRAWGWTLLALPSLLAWDATGLDLPLARLFATPQGFALRDNWFLVQVMHEGAKVLAWLLVLALLVGVYRPVGFLRRLEFGERAQLTLSVLASVVLVSLVKHGSRSSCPYDLEAFGGVARYVSHWSWGHTDGGPGRCFPAGHASAAFSFASGYFVLARRMPQVARTWLLMALAGGLLLGLAQQMRGAHYMSHTLWTAWLCWTTGLVIDSACAAWRKRAAAAVALPHDAI